MTGINKTLIPAVFIISMFAVTFVQAQEGYPLDGTWRSDWGPSAENTSNVVIIMKWDGENINCMINPGRNAYDFKSAQLDPETWAVSIEAENPEGEPVKIEGRLTNIGSYKRTIEGNWIQAGDARPFILRRE